MQCFPMVTQPLVRDIRRALSSLTEHVIYRADWVVLFQVCLVLWVN